MSARAGGPIFACMVWDLRGALLKKGEFETARLAEFAFKHRVRTFRLLAEAIGEDADALARLTVRATDTQMLERMADARPDLAVTLASLHDRCAVEARTQLIAELGDPTPHRLL